MFISELAYQALQNMWGRFRVELILLFKLKINLCHTIYYLDSECLSNLLSLEVLENST